MTKTFSLNILFLLLYMCSNKVSLNTKEKTFSTMNFDICLLSCFVHHRFVLPANIHWFVIFILIFLNYSGPVSFPHFVQLEYVSEPSQLEFLQLLSERAHQQITYHCKNSVPWPHGNSDDVTKSIKMLTVNGLELHAKSSNKYKPKLVGDDCSVRLIFFNHWVIQMWSY